MHRIMPLLMLVLALGTGALLPGRAEAEMIGDARIPFSADRLVIVNGHRYMGRVFHTPGKQRHEQEIRGLRQYVILDAAAARGWLVLPDLRTYVEFAFPQALAALGDPALRRTPIGREAVNGIRTTKYRISHTTPDGTHAEGFLWLSADGVLMKLDGTVTSAGSARPVVIRMELSQLQKGPQDPALFEIPPGLTRLPAEALMPLLGGRPQG